MCINNFLVLLAARVLLRRVDVNDGHAAAAAVFFFVVVSIAFDDDGSLAGSC